MIRPLHDEVIVRLDESEATTKGGIHIPDAARSRTRFATAVAVGPGLFNRAGARKEMGVKAGDRVLLRELFEHESDLKKYVDDEGRTLHILREDDVLAVVEGA